MSYVHADVLSSELMIIAYFFSGIMYACEIGQQHLYEQLCYCCF